MKAFGDFRVALGRSVKDRRGSADAPGETESAIQYLDYELLCITYISGYADHLNSKD